MGFWRRKKKNRQIALSKVVQELQECLEECSRKEQEQHQATQIAPYFNADGSPKTKEFQLGDAPPISVPLLLFASHPQLLLNEMKLSFNVFAGDIGVEELQKEYTTGSTAPLVVSFSEDKDRQSVVQVEVSFKIKEPTAAKEQAAASDAQSI